MRRLMKNLTNTSVTNSKKMLGLENYVKIIQELQNSGLINLNNFHELSYFEKDGIFQEILRWSVFDNNLRILKTNSSNPQH
jgi:hypothetical protein